MSIQPSPSQRSLRPHGPDKRAQRTVAKDRVIEPPFTGHHSPAIADSLPSQRNPVIDPHSSGDASHSVGSSPISRLSNEIKHTIVEQANPESVVNLALSPHDWHDFIIAITDMKRLPSLLKLQTLYRMGVDDDAVIKLLSDTFWEDLMTISVCRLTWRPKKKFFHVRLSPFHVAAAKGNEKMVAFFMDKQYYIGSWHCRYSVPKYVVRVGNLEMLDFLIEKGLPEARSDSLVSVAAAAGHEKIVDRLLELNPGLLSKQGAWSEETQTTPLAAAMSSTDAIWRKMVPHLLSKGAVFTEWNIRWACWHGFENRLIAAQWGNFNCDRRTEDAKGAIM
ncbi:hypothetical protein CEP52_015743 [Fusarium oligoseptatum]|uniref:Ankyrin repeat protein n=1 Tax=Fusarium oligoseptatum TaxID=2604345 RepID=A0A428SA54_9HYPO|nr:hypothetical protein CEP52_015743 [Fusarium oligoseptatum]